MKISPFTVKTLLIGITTTILIISSLPIAALAQVQPKNKLNIKFPKIAKVGAPPRSTGTGARKAPCGFKNFGNEQISTDADESSVSLTALTPENNVLTTIAANPSIYVYIPKTVKKSVEFRMIDIEKESVVYETSFPLSKNPGIMKVNTPKTVNLKSGHKYQWQFLVMCDPQDREADEIVEGWVERIALTPEQQKRIQQTKPESVEIAQLYAEYGAWNETINVLSKLRDRNFKANILWVELLNSVTLGTIAQNPLFDSTAVSSSINPSPKNYNGN